MLLEIYQETKVGLLWFPAMQLLLSLKAEWDPLMAVPGWYHSEASAPEKQGSQRANTPPPPKDLKQQLYILGGN